MSEGRKYARTTRLIIMCVGVLLGLIWSRKSPLLPWQYVLAAFIFSVVCFKRARIISVYTLILFGFSLGWWRGGIAMENVRYVQSINKDKITISAKVLSDATYDNKKQLSFDIGNVVALSEDNAKINGKIGISGFGESMVYRGDEVLVSGKFSTGRGSYTGYMSFAEVNITAKSHSAVYKLSRSFSAGMQNALPEPYASFGMGILIGQRSTLPEYIGATLSIVGLTHIIAVSGYNVTIMINAAKKLLGKRSKFQTWLGCQALMLLFLLVTGFSASIIRAVCISSLTLGAWYYGRTIKPLLVLLLVAAGTALYYPPYLWSDLGWHLSFLAFYGVLIIAPLIQKKFLDEDNPKVVSGLIVETISAQVMTLPLILYIFHDSHFLALPANILVVPFIPIAMLFSFIAGLAGMLIPAFAGWIALPAKLLLTYIIDMASFFARVPKMKFSISFPAYGLFIMYASITFITLVLWHKTKQTAKITEVKREV